jgi:hypothetical protein
VLATYERYCWTVLEYNAQADVGDFTDAGTSINAFWWSDLIAATYHRVKGSG